MKPTQHRPLAPATVIALSKRSRTRNTSSHVWQHQESTRTNTSRTKSEEASTLTVNHLAATHLAVATAHIQGAEALRRREGRARVAHSHGQRRAWVPQRREYCATDSARRVFKRQVAPGVDVASVHRRVHTPLLHASPVVDTAGGPGQRRAGEPDG